MVDGKIPREVVPGHLAAVTPHDAAKDLVEEMFLLAAFRHVATDPVAVHRKGRGFDAAVCCHVVDGSEVSAVHQIALEGIGQRGGGFEGVRFQRVACDARHLQVLRERQRVEMKIDARRAAPAARQKRAGFVNDDRIRTGENQDEVFQQTGIGKELDAAVPPANVGHFVNEQVCRLRWRAIRCGPREQRDQGMMVIDKLPRQVENALRRHAPIQQGRTSTASARWTCRSSGRR